MFVFEHQSLREQDKYKIYIKTKHCYSKGDIRIKALVILFLMCMPMKCIKMSRHILKRPCHDYANSGKVSAVFLKLQFDNNSFLTP